MNTTKDNQDMADRIADILVEDHVELMNESAKLRELADRCIKAMLLLAEVEPHLDEWNFPITLHERVTALCNEHFGDVRPMTELNAGIAE